MWDKPQSFIICASLSRVSLRYRTLDHVCAKSGWLGTVGAAVCANVRLTWRSLVSKLRQVRLTWRSLVFKLRQVRLTWRSFFSNLRQVRLTWRKLGPTYTHQRYVEACWLVWVQSLPCVVSSLLRPRATFWQSQGRFMQRRNASACAWRHLRASVRLLRTRLCEPLLLPFRGVCD